MITPTDGMFKFISNPEHILLNRMLITSITITQDSPSTLYQVPFELTTAPTRAWKDVLMDTWQSIIQQKKKIRNP